MNVRPFDWRDLPALHRFRHQSVYLNSPLVLTRGPMLLSGALLSTLAPAMGIFTSVSQNDAGKDQMLIGQTLHSPGAQCAQLTFLTPDEALDSDGLPPLLDHLSGQAVERGAFRLLADVDERTQAFEALRRAGYAIYARQRVWQLKDEYTGTATATDWSPAVDKDLIQVRSLYNNLIPGLVQQVEPFSSSRLHGLVYRQREDVLAFVELRYGHRGIWAQPFFHPDVEDASGRLADLLDSNLINRLSRPIYLCVRSYQSWLELAMEELGAEPGPRQAVMVKHLAIPQKALRALTLPAIDGGRPEISAPISQSQALPQVNGGSGVAKLEKHS